MLGRNHEGSMIKYQFKIRTRNGLIVENLNIAGTDRADAERKLLRMYLNSEVLECTELFGGSGREESMDLNTILALMARQEKEGD